MNVYSTGEYVVELGSTRKPIMETIEALTTLIDIMKDLEYGRLISKDPNGVEYTWTLAEVQNVRDRLTDISRVRVIK